MASSRQSDRQDQVGMGSTPIRIRPESCTSRTIRGRELNALFEERFVNKASKNSNSNNSNVSNDNISNNNIACSTNNGSNSNHASNSNSSNNNISRRSELDSMYPKNRIYTNSNNSKSKSNNIITIINSSIDFEKDVHDAVRGDIPSPGDSDRYDQKPGFAQSPPCDAPSRRKSLDPCAVTYCSRTTVTSQKSPPGPTTLTYGGTTLTYGGSTLTYGGSENQPPSANTEVGNYSAMATMSSPITTSRHSLTSNSPLNTSLPLTSSSPLAAALTPMTPEQAVVTSDPAGKSTAAAAAADPVTSGGQDMTFSCPKQNQVFQTLKGIQLLRADTTLADLTVEVKGQEFKCHKVVLANSSGLLKNLIEGVEQQAQQAHVEQEDTPELHSGCTTKEDNVDRQESKTQDKTTADGAIDLEQNRNNNYSSEQPGETPSEEFRTKDVQQKENPNSEDENPAVSVATFDKTKELVVLNDVTPCIFEKVLDFSYCVFDDVINKDNAQQLLEASDILKMPFLSQTCVNFIVDSLSPSNVYDVIKLLDSGLCRLFDQRLALRVHQVLRENFIQLACREEFLGLSSQHVRDLVADSMLHVPGEVTVVTALLRWVMAKPEERTAKLTLILQHIRFPLMTSQELDEMADIALIGENKLAKALIRESRCYSLLDYPGRLSWPRQNSTSRRLFASRDFLLWTADRDKGLHFYSAIDGIHHKVTTFNLGGVNSGVKGSTSGAFVFDSTSSVCCYEEKIFFSGGEFMTDRLWSIDTRTSQITVHAPMPRGRKLHSAIASHGIVYCLGGQDKRGYTVLDSVDAYIISKDTWVTAGKLAEPAYNMTAVVSDASITNTGSSSSSNISNNSGGIIYLLGGEDHAGKPLRVIQCFEWLPPRLYSAYKVEVTGMPPSLFSARAVTSGLEGHVYVVCGDGEVYKFSPSSQHLSHVTTMRDLSDNPRQRFGLAHVGGRLIVIGGHQLGHVSHEPIRSVCLDIATKQEVRGDHVAAPMLPGDNINTCMAAKLSTNTLSLFI